MNSTEISLNEETSLTLSTALFIVAQLPVWMLHEAYAANAMEFEARPACYQVNTSHKTLAHVCITKDQWCRIYVAMGEFKHETCEVEQTYATCCE